MDLYLRFLPELGLLGLSLALFLVTVTVGGESDDADPSRRNEKRNAAAFVSEHIGLFGSIGVLILAALAIWQDGTLFFDAYRVGLFSQLVKIALAAGLVGAMWLARDARNLPVRDRPEFLLFMALSTLGMMMLVSADELISFYVVLELSAYCLYIMVPMASGHGSHNEASYKYFIYGATTSAISLYGMSILYGLAGTTSIPGIAAALGAAPTALALAAVVLAITGILFKLAVFPFHFWAPDVYQVSTHSAAAFIAATSKVGAVAALLRLLLIGADIERLYWVLGGLAVLSMTFGNLAAIAQKDLKRLLAYSGVAQGGYILLGLMGQDHAGYTAAAYYTAGYLAMVLLCFLVIVEVGRTLPATEGGRPSNVLPISSLDGLHQRSPVLALALLVGLLGMAGVPPTAGFTGKWLLFKAAIEVDAFWLVFIAGVNNTIAVYYYLIVVKAAYVHGPEGQPALRPGLVAKLAGLGVSLGVVLLGVFPQWVVPALDRAMTALLGG